MIIKFLIKHFLWTFFFTLLVLGVANTVRDSNIPEYRYANGTWGDYVYTPDYDKERWNILLDQHSHTLYSDGVLSVEQNIQWHIAMGFNAMVISDHNTFDGLDEAMSIARQKYADQIVVIPGLEWTTQRLHMNFLFPPSTSEQQIKEAIALPSNKPSDAQIAEAIAAAQAFGALVTVNHIPWTDENYPGQQPGRDKFAEWGVDFIETINEKYRDYLSEEFYAGTAVNALSGTDMHTPGSVYAWTLLNASEFTAEAVFASLHSGDTELIYDPIGSPYPFDAEAYRNPSYTLLRPLIAIGDYFTQLTWPEIRGGELAILLAWIYITSLALSGLYQLARRVTN